MPHEVYGEKAVYAVRPAWHRIGTVLDDVFTAEQALNVINPDRIPVMQWPAGVQDPTTGKWYATDSFLGTVQVEDRSDPNNVKLTVFDYPSPDHRLIQDWEQLAWMDAIVGNEEGAHYEAAVKLRGGTQTILTINLGKTVLDPNGRKDVNWKYLFGFNSHNRSWPLGAKFADMRAECANMAAMVMRDGTKPEYKTKHTTNLMERVAMAQQVLGLEVTWHRLYMDTAEVLIQTEMTDNQFQRLLNNIFVDPDTKERDVESTETVRAIYELNPTQHNLYGTWWGGFNSISYFNDWQTVVRGGKTSKEEMRFLRQFDDTKGLKQRAWEAVVEMAEV